MLPVRGFDSEQAIEDVFATLFCALNAVEYVEPQCLFFEDVV